MNNFVSKFNEFVNEELNYTQYEDGVYELEDRWFYYNADDDIVYGTNTKPVDVDCLFSFNPSSCTIIMGGEEKNYDVSNPVCLITYDVDKEKVTIYTDKIMEYFETLGFKGSDFTSKANRNKIMDIFEDNDDMRFILIQGTKMIASTFDVIEEN